MASIPPERGVERSLLSWLDGVGGKSKERLNHAVSPDVIRKSRHDLNTLVCADATGPKEDIELRKELSKLQELQNDHDDLEAAMRKHLEVLMHG